MTKPVSQIPGLKPTHPGEVLREDILPALGLSEKEVATRLRVSRKTIVNILEERRPVTVLMALKLSRLLGNAPQFWTNLQLEYDLAILRETMRDELAAIQTLRTNVA